MNENAKLWVHTLRSGQYDQATGGLRLGDTFCCLGVACDLYDEGGWEDCCVSQRAYRATDEEFEDVLPSDVRKWLGLNDALGSFSVSDDVAETSLANANDGGATFEEIADLIEQYQDQLFMGTSDVV